MSDGWWSHQDRPVIEVVNLLRSTDRFWREILVDDQTEHTYIHIYIIYI